MCIRRIQRRLAAENIRLSRINPLSPLEELPEHVQQEINRDPDVRRDEVVDVERPEDVEAIEQDDDAEEDQGGPGNIGLEGRAEDQSVAVDALGFEGFVELDVGDADADPGEEAGDSGEVLEPFEGNAGALGAGEVC